MNELLEKTRKINRLVQETGIKPIDFNKLADVLQDVLNCNVLILNKDGKVLGQKLLDETLLDDAFFVDGNLPESYNQKLLDIREARFNYQSTEPILADQFTTVIPSINAGKRVGTLVLSRHEEKVADKYLFLAEYGAALVGIWIKRSQNYSQEKDIRKRATVQIAIDTLSYSELEAVQEILTQLDGTEGILVAGKIADTLGIARSVIVNALRKLESSGVVESRSLGMKGTFIKVLNDYLFEELENNNILI